MPDTPAVTTLVEFSFTSRAVADLPFAALRRISAQTRLLNPRMGFTGELRFCDGMFHQVLEGQADEVLLLSARILTDRRHEGISVMSLRPIVERRYTEWRLVGFASAEEAVSERALPANLPLPPAGVRRFPGGSGQSHPASRWRA